MARSIFAMAVGAAFQASRTIMGPSADGDALLIWWPTTWPLTNKRGIETTFHTPLIRAMKGPGRRTAAVAVGAAEVPESTVTFALASKDLPAGVPAVRGIHFMAGTTRETAQIYRALVVNEVAGMVEIEATED